MTFEAVCVFCGAQNAVPPQHLDMATHFGNLLGKAGRTLVYGQQPIHANIVGVHLQVAAHDIVECNVPPYEMEFCIEVLRHGAAR